MGLEDTSRDEETKVMTFKEGDETLEVECTRIDINEPKFDQPFDDADTYKKSAEVKAYQVKEGEEPVKITTGIDATTSIAPPGEWVITNPTGEVYRATNETFQENYKAKEGEPGSFVTLGTPVKVLPVSKDIVFMAPWGSDQGVRKGGFLIERINTDAEGNKSKERYGIDKESFEATYKKVE